MIVQFCHRNEDLWISVSEITKVTLQEQLLLSLENLFQIKLASNDFD